MPEQVNSFGLQILKCLSELVEKAGLKCVVDQVTNVLDPDFDSISMHFIVAQLVVFDSEETFGGVEVSTVVAMGNRDHNIATRGELTQKTRIDQSVPGVSMREKHNFGLVTNDALCSYIDWNLDLQHGLEHVASDYANPGPHPPGHNLHDPIDLFGAISTERYPKLALIDAFSVGWVEN